MVKKCFLRGYPIANLIEKFPQNDDTIMHEEFLDEHEEDSHN